MQYLKYPASMILIMLFSSFSLQGCGKDEGSTRLPFENLKTADLQSKEFLCKYEADLMPPIDRQAENWNQQALFLTRNILPPQEQNWKKAKKLWARAAANKHWISMIALAQVYEKDHGEAEYSISANPSLSIKIIEELMTSGSPAAYGMMGNYYATGFGSIISNRGRALDFWAKAAEMGNAEAQTAIGQARLAAIQNQDDDKVENLSIVMDIFNCAASQGNGQAAFDLAMAADKMYLQLEESSRPSLENYQLGLMLGNANAASALAKKFSAAVSAGENSANRSRAQRYQVLEAALRRNPDLKFPNLDRFLPLPPAALPVWYGDVESMIETIKPVLIVSPQTLFSSLPRANENGISDYRNSIKSVSTHAINRKFRASALPAYDGSFHLSNATASGWKTQPVYLRSGSELPKKEPSATPPFNTVRIINRAKFQDPQISEAGRINYQSGIWYPLADRLHPQFKVIDPYLNQRYLKAGDVMPDATAWGLPTSGKIIWYLLEADNQAD